MQAFFLCLLVKKLQNNNCLWGSVPIRQRSTLFDIVFALITSNLYFSFSKRDFLWAFDSAASTVILPALTSASSELSIAHMP